MAERAEALEAWGRFLDSADKAAAERSDTPTRQLRRRCGSARKACEDVGESVHAFGGCFMISLVVLTGIIAYHALGKYRGRDVYSVLWRVAGRGFLSLALVGGAVGYVSFDLFNVPSLDRIRQVAAAVVFTGQFERVDVGLHLADAGAVPRLYISGVNGNAGMDPAHFVEQFSIRNPDIADLRRLFACCVEWGERADNTFQNAQDTKCWVDRRGLTGSLLLITSRQHMARAMAALSGALPDRVIAPYPVEEGPPTVGRTRLPRS
jgi:DUF218 domain-containing protein